MYHASILLGCVCQVELLAWFHWSGLQLVVMYGSIVVGTFLVRVHPVMRDSSSHCVKSIDSSLYIFYTKKRSLDKKQKYDG